MTTLYSQTTLASSGSKGDQNYDIEGKLCSRRSLALHAHGRQYCPPCFVLLRVNSKYKFDLVKRLKKKLL